MQLTEYTYFGENNRYYLEKLLGRGGFSEVWLAQDNLTHQQMALKVYVPGTGLDDEGLQTFSEEFARVSNLHHQNLLTSQHVDAWKGMPYLTMSYCAHGSLVKKIGKMSEPEIRKVLHDVASGLAYLHAHDVIHQDIKPDNILLDDTGNYVITDFGISTRTRSTLRKSVAASSSHSGGTIAYMGPERFGKEPAPVKASDIWSLGAMLYELMIGDTPFGEHGGLIQKSGAEIPTIQGNYSDELKQMVEQMLSLNPWDRPTAEDLAAGYAVPSVSSAPTRNRPTVAMPTTSSAQPASAPTTEQNTAPIRKRSTEVTPTTSSQSKSTPTPSAHPKETTKVLITILIFVLLGLGVTVGILRYNSHQEEVRNEQLAKAQRQAEENARIAEQEKKAALERARQAEKQLNETEKQLNEAKNKSSFPVSNGVFQLQSGALLTIPSCFVAHEKFGPDDQFFNADKTMKLFVSSGGFATLQNAYSVWTESDYGISITYQRISDKFAVVSWTEGQEGAYCRADLVKGKVNFWILRWNRNYADEEAKRILNNFEIKFLK